MTNLRPHRRVPFTLAATIALSAVLALGFSSVPEANAVSNGKLVFVSSQSGDGEIAVINPDGSGRRELTDNDVSDDGPAWSPDGRRIAFSRKVNLTYGIFVMNTNGTDQHMISNGDDNSPSWSPDGAKIVFSTYRDAVAEIYVMDADGSNPDNISNAIDSDTSPA